MKSMNIQDLISGKHDRAQVDVDGLSIPIRTSKKLLGDGYAHLRVYEENRTVSLCVGGDVLCMFYGAEAS